MSEGVRVRGREEKWGIGRGGIFYGEGSTFVTCEMV
jgi:hypothetical protein